MKSLLIVFLLNLLTSTICLSQKNTEQEQTKKVRSPVFYRIYYPSNPALNKPNEPTICKVDESNSIIIPHIGKLKITEKTTTDEIRTYVITKLPSSLNKDTLNDITVIKFDRNFNSSKTSKFITVFGDIKNPGAIKTNGVILTLKEVILIAEPTSFADLSCINIYREGKTYSYNLNQAEHRKEKIYPHDQIQVPTRFRGGK